MDEPEYVIPEPLPGVQSLDVTVERILDLKRRQAVGEAPVWGECVVSSPQPQPSKPRRVRDALLLAAGVALGSLATRAAYQFSSSPTAPEPSATPIPRAQNADVHSETRGTHMSGLVGGDSTIAEPSRIIEPQMRTESRIEFEHGDRGAIQLPVRTLEGAAAQAWKEQYRSSLTGTILYTGFSEGRNDVYGLPAGQLARDAPVPRAFVLPEVSGRVTSFAYSWEGQVFVVVGNQQVYRFSLETGSVERVFSGVEESVRLGLERISGQSQVSSVTVDRVLQETYGLVGQRAVVRVASSVSPLGERGLSLLVASDHVMHWYALEDGLLIGGRGVPRVADVASPDGRLVISGGHVVARSAAGEGIVLPRTSGYQWVDEDLK